MIPLRQFTCITVNMLVVYSAALQLIAGDKREKLNPLAQAAQSSQSSKSPVHDDAGLELKIRVAHKYAWGPTEPAHDPQTYTSGAAASGVADPAAPAVAPVASSAGLPVPAEKELKLREEHKEELLQLPAAKDNQISDIMIYMPTWYSSTQWKGKSRFIGLTRMSRDQTSAQRMQTVILTDYGRGDDNYILCMRNDEYVISVSWKNQLALHYQGPFVDDLLKKDNPAYERIAHMNKTWPCRTLFPDHHPFDNFFCTVNPSFTAALSTVNDGFRVYRITRQANKSMSIVPTHIVTPKIGTSLSAESTPVPLGFTSDDECIILGLDYAQLHCYHISKDPSQDTSRLIGPVSKTAGSITEAILNYHKLGLIATLHMASGAKVSIDPFQLSVASQSSES